MATRRLRSVFESPPLRRFRAPLLLAALLAGLAGGCTTLRTGPWPTTRVDDPPYLSPYRQSLTRPQTVGRFPAAPNPAAARNLFAPRDNVAARPAPLTPVPQTEPLPQAGPSTAARPQPPAVSKFPAAPNPSAGATPRTAPDPAAVPDGPTIVPPQTQSAAALALTVEAPTRVAVDGGAVFRFRIVNNGTGTARDISLACDFDDALRLPGRSDRFVERRLAELPAGAAREFALTLASPAPGKPCLRVRLLEGIREAAWKSVCLEVVERRLAVDVVGPERRTVGTRAEFLLKLTNVSSEPLSNVVVVVRHDPVLQAKEASAGALQETHALRWNLGDIAVGESVQPQVEFACAVPGETACFVVTVQGAGLPDEILERCLAVEAPPSSLVLHVADSVDPVRLGDETVLAAWVTHRETQPVRGLEFELTLPERLRVATIEVFADRQRIEAAPRIDGRTVRLGPLPDLAAGVRLEIRATGKALRDGDDEFRAKIVGGSLGTGTEAAERLTVNR